MSFAKKFNTPSASFTWEMPENHDYIDLKELVGKHGLDQAHLVRMIYINKKGKFGDNPVVATDDHLVNLPNHLLEVAKEILNDQSAVEAINKEKVAFTVYQYSNQYGTQYSINWLDVKPPKEKAE